MLRRRAVRALAAVGAAAAIALAAVAPAHVAAKPTRPNIVFILADDFSTNLVPYMPQLRRMQKDGLTFSNYFVTNSLCCPSRASIFTGQFPHDHEVLTNTPPFGGFSAFRYYGGENATFATALKRSGYQTALLGKVMNGYLPSSRHVPPGWTMWNVAGSAYDGFGYVLNENGKRTARYGKSARSYVTDVLSRRGRKFMSRAARAHKPFLVEVSTFAPHHPFTPAPRDAHTFRGLRIPRTPAYDAATEGAPAWLAERGPLSPGDVAEMDRDFRKRVQSVQAIDDMIGAVRRTLKRRRIDKNTYIVFSSDNGMHMGEHRLRPGKMTAFDHDIRVPLIVVGPGVPKGATVDELAANVDLAPTFMGIGRLKPPPSVDGRSLGPLLRGEPAGDWRDAVLLEHTYPEPSFDDPDLQGRPSGAPPSYSGLRTRFGTYVEYRTGEQEYYDVREDPHQLRNVWDSLSGSEQQSLEETLAGLRACHRGDTCWAAAQR